MTTPCTDQRAFPLCPAVGDWISALSAYALLPSKCRHPLSVVARAIKQHVVKYSDQMVANGSFATKLRAGKNVYGTFMMLASGWTARTVAGRGWDVSAMRTSKPTKLTRPQYVIIDCEHGNISDSDMHESVNAVASCDVAPIVRIRGPDAGLIKRALDCGAQWVAPLYYDLMLI